MTYTQIDEGSPALSEWHKARATVITERMAAIEGQREQERFAVQAAYEDGGGRDFETDEEEDAYRKGLREKAAQLQLELDWLHEQLRKLGCRVMRPYEHWNEDEALMQYLEVDRFG